MSGVLDRALYALFGGHADRRRHATDRRRYRGTTGTEGFDVYLARLYGASWVAFALAAVLAGGLAWATPLATTVAGAVDPLTPLATAGLVGALTGLLAKRGALLAGSLHLRWVLHARRADIDRTLPSAVRYLRVLASAGSGERALFDAVAARERAYGETAVAFGTVRNKAALSGSLGQALRVVARDTPSRDALAPFLLKFREHAATGPDAVEQFLRLEARMLANRQARARTEAEGFLELLAELFVVLLVMPALVVVSVTVMSVLAPGLGAPVAIAGYVTTPRTLLVAGCGVFVLGIGAIAAALVGVFRPSGFGDHWTRSRGLGVLANAPHNPADALLVLAPLAPALAVGFAAFGVGVWDALVLAYAGVAVPVGVVAARRSRADDAKDRELKDAVHAIAGHVSLGVPFADAVGRVVEDGSLDALRADTADLARRLDFPSSGEDRRTAALAAYAERVGTPLADQAIGLVAGALTAGSEVETAFDALQAEVGRLYHEKKALRSELAVYVAVGWTTALLVVGIVVAINAYVLDSFAQLSTVSTATTGLSLAPDAVDPSRDRHHFYLVTQATMLSCGWFAAMASRGRYAALLHSGLLALAAFCAFRIGGFA
ncbi:type II secretion system F family protein [Salarchaeum japonicum]|uniref:type II secretion system F family protein n=1 Tax=Salarchaeum japonicum TaxID=555573 RepID=UPI003C77E5F2